VRSKLTQLGTRFFTDGDVVVAAVPPLGLVTLTPAPAGRCHSWKSVRLRCRVDCDGFTIRERASDPTIAAKTPPLAGLPGWACGRSDRIRLPGRRLGKGFRQLKRNQKQ